MPSYDQIQRPTLVDIVPDPRIDDAWQYARINDLSGGLNTQIPDTALPDSFTPSVEGIVFHSGVPETDDALEDVDLSGLNGTIQAVFAAPTLNSGVKQIVLTTTRIYIRTAPGIYAEIPQGSGETSSASTWNADMLPSWDTSDSDWSGAIVSLVDPNEPARLNGDVDIIPSWDIYPSRDWIVITNGVDTPFYIYEDNGVDRVATLGGLIGVEDVALAVSFTARIVVCWQNLILFFDTTERHHGETMVTRRRFRVRRSDPGNPTVWLPATNNRAGRDDLLDLPEAIIGARSLGQFLVVYRTDSLIRAAWTGGSPLIDFNTVIRTDGPISPSAITSLDDLHIFVGRLGMYLYNGSLNVDLISVAVERELFAPNGLLNQGGPKKARLATYPERRTILLTIPYGLDTRVYSTHIPKNLTIPRWSRRMITGPVDMIGNIRPLAMAAINWDTAALPVWGASGLDWQDTIEQVNRYSTPVLINRADLEHTKLYTGVPGNIEWEFRTRVFGVDKEDVRLDIGFILSEGDDFDLTVLLDRVAPSIPVLKNRQAEGPGVKWAQCDFQVAEQEIQLILRNIANRPSQIRIHSIGFRFKSDADATTGAP